MCRDDAGKRQTITLLIPSLKLPLFFFCALNNPSPLSPVLSLRCFSPSLATKTLALGPDAPLLGSISPGELAIGLGLKAHSARRSFLLLALAWVLSLANL